MEVKGVKGVKGRSRGVREDAKDKASINLLDLLPFTYILLYILITYIYCKGCKRYFTKVNGSHLPQNAHLASPQALAHGYGADKSFGRNWSAFGSRSEK